MRDFAWGATRSFKPLHKICDFDLMLDAHLSDGHPHKAEPFLDAFHPFVLAQRSEPQTIRRRVCRKNFSSSPPNKAMICKVNVFVVSRDVAFISGCARDGTAG